MDFGNGSYGSGRGFGNSYWGDNVPCDVPAPMDVEITHYCSGCGAKWDVVMDYELGSYFYYDEDNDPICPECGHDSRYNL